MQVPDASYFRRNDAMDELFVELRQEGVFDNGGAVHDSLEGLIRARHGCDQAGHCGRIRHIKGHGFNLRAAFDDGCDLAFFFRVRFARARGKHDAPGARLAQPISNRDAKAARAAGDEVA